MKACSPGECCAVFLPLASCTHMNTNWLSETTSRKLIYYFSPQSLGNIFLYQTCWISIYRCMLLLRARVCAHTYTCILFYIYECIYKKYCNHHLIWKYLHALICTSTHKPFICSTKIPLSQKSLCCMWTSAALANTH